jgi:hypothetical protein
MRKPVHPRAQKYSASRLTQIKLTVSAVPHSQEGRFAIVTDVGRGMRWTHISERSSFARTNGVCADGEVVWFWRPDAGAKFVETIPRMTVATKHGHREEHEGNR